MKWKKLFRMQSRTILRFVTLVSTGKSFPKKVENKMRKIAKVAIMTLGLAFASTAAHAQNVIGSVDTAWALGGNHRVDMEKVPDPALPVTCYISHPITGGFMGKMGLARNHSLFSISCLKNPNMTPVDLSKIPQSENLMSQRTSWFSNMLVLSRFVDKENDNVVYMVTAQGELIDGSPFSSVSAVSMH